MESDDRQEGSREFGAFLRAARAAAGFTQEELSDRSGVSVRTIRNLEKGSIGRPRKQSLWLLTKVLGVSEKSLDDALGEIRGDDSGPRWEVPAGHARLIGRDEVVERLCRRLVESGRAEIAGPVPARSDGTAPDPARDVTRLAVLTGPPGSGRTAVLAQVARRVRDAFPDGQIYVDLSGSPESRATAHDLAARLLRSLDASVRVADPAERLARLRGLLAERSVLVVLDGAVAEEHVRPLLAGSPRSALLVGADRELPALGRGPALRLDPLDPGACAELLADLIGRDRVAAEPGALDRLVEACGRLPLALHIAGLWLAARPSRRLSELADRLAERNGRLDQLAVGDLSLRASVGAFLRRQPPQRWASLDELGALHGPFVPADLARLFGIPLAQAVDLAEEYEHSQLVRASDGGPEGASLYRLEESVRMFLDAPQNPSVSPAVSAIAADLPVRLPVPMSLVRGFLDDEVGRASIG
ncbi:helix-turn-helix domain-containing protein [Streptomyces sp. NPDC051684]|uniref:helix-turn-helix domain-containing protein n=1 Tax=Streptomyces sp. NPDC051684 TaxID=3365670 RepID=UPI00379D8396